MGTRTTRSTTSPCWAFQKATFNAIVDGIVEAIDRAHASKAPGDILLNQGELTEASRNRSAPAFRRNPAGDRAAFPLEIDPLMTVLTFQQAGRAVGALSLFPTHGTSMTNTNTLISGDNKGYAAYHWGARGGQGALSRRWQSPSWPRSRKPTRGHEPQLNLKPGSGPTEDEFENTRIIGQRQSDKARELASNANQVLSGEVDYRMRFVDMSQPRASGQRLHARPASAHHLSSRLGASFAAGSTEDGPGPGIAQEGTANPFLTAIGGLLFPIPDSLRQCHGAKEVVIPVGLMQPYPWVPEVLPLQLVRVGNLYLATLPGEPTIMSGYRIRRQLAQTLGVPVNQVLVVGYSNAYTEYITTPEEYSHQDYEGGSTLFGPGPSRPTCRNSTSWPRPWHAARASATPCVRVNWAAANSTSDRRGHGPAPSGQGLRHRAARCPSQLPPRADRGRSLPERPPKNNLRRNGSFLEVQRWNGSQWVSTADDGDWSTRYRWRRTFGAESVVDISWTIPADQAAGTYRIVHDGNAKSLWGTISSFRGTTRPFTVAP